MYLTKNYLESVFHQLRKIGPDTGKTRLERVSALSRFLAIAELLQKSGSKFVDLSPSSPDRNNFVLKVGSILGLGEISVFTPDFVHRAESLDYRLGSNFLTTIVKRTRDAKGSYPGRPKPLVSFENEKASLHSDFKSNIEGFYGVEKYRDALAIWLAKDFDFTEGITVDQFIKTVNSYIEDRFGDAVADILYISDEGYNSLFGKFPPELTADKPNLIDLAKDIDSDTAVIPESAMVSAIVGRNLLIYGAPGTGKSHMVDKIIGEAKVVRTVFHADTQNSDFFGSLKPRMFDDSVRYEFSPGPFSKALKAALIDPDNQHFLVIEELNRAPAASVFGEIFQLMDRREDGSSTYEIDYPNPESEEWFSIGLENTVNKLSIPANLTILATMNSADQGVFPLDTAFRRRWEQEYLPLYQGEGPHGELFFTTTKQPRVGISWVQFVKALNSSLISELGVPEDRLLGVWFLKESELGGEIPAKILLYLWDDLLRHEGRSKIFRTQRIRTFGELHTALKSNSPIFSDSFLAMLENVGNPSSVSESDSGLDELKSE